MRRVLLAAGLSLPVLASFASLASAITCTGFCGDMTTSRPEGTALLFPQGVNTVMSRVLEAAATNKLSNSQIQSVIWLVQNEHHPSDANAAMSNTARSAIRTGGTPPRVDFNRIPDKSVYNPGDPIRFVFSAPIPASNTTVIGMMDSDEFVRLALTNEAVCETAAGACGQYEFRFLVVTKNGAGDMTNYVFTGGFRVLEHRSIRAIMPEATNFQPGTILTFGFEDRDDFSDMKVIVTEPSGDIHDLTEDGRSLYSFVAQESGEHEIFLEARAGDQSLEEARNIFCVPPAEPIPVIREVPAVTVAAVIPKEPVRQEPGPVVLHYRTMKPGVREWFEIRLVCRTNTGKICLEEVSIRRREGSWRTASNDESVRFQNGIKVLRTKKRPNGWLLDFMVIGRMDAGKIRYVLDINPALTGLQKKGLEEILGEGGTVSTFYDLMPVKEP
jgi:hypothetical protein